MPEDSHLTIRDMAATIAKALHLKEGDTVEIKVNKLDANELKIIRHPQEAAPPR